MYTVHSHIQGRVVTYYFSEWFDVMNHAKYQNKLSCVYLVTVIDKHGKDVTGDMK